MLKGQKKVRRDEAFLHAVVVLRRCAGLSFYTISQLLHGSETQKRNIEYYFNRDKDRFPCEKDNKYIHEEEVNVPSNSTQI